MPPPTLRDLYALSLFAEPEKITRFEHIVSFPYGDAEKADEQLAFGPPEERSLAARLMVHLLRTERAVRGHPGVAIPLSPVFDELWDLKGRHATFEDMHRMVLGGKEAAEVRQEVADALQKGKGRETKAHDQQAAEAILDNVPSRLSEIEEIMDEVLVRMDTNDYQPQKPTHVFSDVTSEWTDVDR